ncbi:MAG TPA: alanyl-tRNA editing protein, partial [Steroidobacteraceae bacterium]|nr:alanyl-tRNA editing protein [Steroidobacteraceae bacterium]
MTTELLFREDAYLKSATARILEVHERGIELDRTLFYPLGGGQPGDRGVLVRENGERIAIADTRKGTAQGSVVHMPAPGLSRPEPGELVSLELDWDRRYSLMRLHTALHLLSCVVIAPVSGGNIAPDRARLDFDIDRGRLDAEHIMRETNALIASGVATETVWISDEELDAQPELVKTMSVQPPRGVGRVRLLKIPGIDL